MQTWYYSKNGEQMSPVSRDELVALITSSQLNPQKDLAWTEGMANWEPIGQIPALTSSGAVSSSSADSYNPYAAPATSMDDLLAPVPTGPLAEVAPGSVSLDAMECIKRGFELTKRHFANLLIVGIAYIAIAMALGAVEAMLTGGFAPAQTDENGFPVINPAMFPIKVISTLISIMLGAGLTHAALHVVAGRPASVGMLFSQFGKLVSLIGGSILFYLMLAAGVLLLIVPGIWVALRFGLFLNAIVDRNLGPVEALKYSYSITTNNTLNMLGLWIMLALVGLAGALVFLVGLVFALPVITLSMVLAYRFLQYGPQALKDHPGTTTPLLQGTTP